MKTPSNHHQSTQYAPGLSYGMPQAPEGGLWLPEMEGDACGIGFVADVEGRAANRILRKGLESVCCLTHRGAVAADAKTGDGAGVLTQIPYAVLRAGLGRGQSKLLRRNSDLAVAMMFFPQNADQRHRAYRICEKVVEESDLIFLEWRLVPTDKQALGDKARVACPEVRQLLLARLDNMSDEEFERVCYRLRKTMENRIAAEGIEGFYIPSFSSRTIVYKGLMVAPQLSRFYGDLDDDRFETSLVLYHQRYSTNTFPTWFLAQPFRMLAHNGEINTLQGNLNSMRAKSLSRDASIWGSHKALQELQPLIQPGGSDSAALDNALESLVLGGRDLLHTAMMLVPEAYRAVPDMDDDVRAFYEYHACMQEPWDGPAAVSFTDGRVIGATLDRNGLRPVRYQISNDGLFVMGSEVGTVEMEGAKAVEKGRLGPGQIIALDTATGEILKNDDIKLRYARRAPYRHWVSSFLIEGDGIGSSLPASGASTSAVAASNGHAPEAGAHETGVGTSLDSAVAKLVQRQKAFGFTAEDTDDILQPMIGAASEPIGSMGDDTPLAVLSEKPRLLPNYFRQRFAQVTNPPIDPLREKLVMSLDSHLGPASNLWEELPEAARRIRFTSPVLSDEQLAALRSEYSHAGDDENETFHLATVDATFPVSAGEAGLRTAVHKLRSDAEREVESGATLLVISDKSADATRAAIPALMAVGAVHHHLIRKGLRTRVSLICESGEPRDSHGFACLVGFGASAVNPWLAHATVAELHRNGKTDGYEGDVQVALKRFHKAIEGGLLKIMSKMGISTLASYMGAQTFEILGLAPEVVQDCFEHTPSRIKGVSYEEIAGDVLRMHQSAYPSPAGEGNGETTAAIKLENYAFLRYRKDGEQHAFTPSWFKPFHKAVRENDYETQFKIFSKAVDERKKPIALRDMLEWKPLNAPIPLEDVEPIEAIFPRLSTGAMSHGALSSEAHECLAIGMNRIGGRSNSGEGGEDPSRFRRDDNGDWRNSAIKQIASARFGVTPEYLASAKELQIKMAQGAKPGEGGQLPGFKVSPEIGFIRHSVPGVTLISPPPHHDIYSIEDLSQLIYDLKQVNPRARVSVKLVAQAGVGTVAAGVAKAYADTIVISGHDGGTGASPIGSIKNTGVSWELGLAEAQQVLIQNGLRGRVRLHADGGMKTGRDVIIAALLGAEEFGFGTQALMAAGCVMARQCHLNTCPVGVATQRDDLRAKFPGTPEHVVNYMTHVAQEIREYLAAMGVRHLEQIIGRTNLLQIKENPNFPKTRNVDLAPLFYQFDLNDNDPHRSVVGKNTRPEDWPVDEGILQDARDAIAEGRELVLKYPIRNTDRTVGARLAGEIAYRYGDRGLPLNTLTIRFTGTAGQSFGAFCISGLRLELIGEACDYVGKTMHGGTIVVKPREDEIYRWHENAIIGNTVMYGATGGHLYAAGQAGERFCVRNSGGTAVVEGVGDHGCEYMTGGVVVVLGEAGRNFGAGMSGGVAYVYDERKNFASRFNPDMVGIEPVTGEEDISQLRKLIERHERETGSPRAAEMLKNWSLFLGQFHKVVPHPEKTPAPAPTREKKERAPRIVAGRAKPHSSEFSENEPASIDDVSGIPAEVK